MKRSTGYLLGLSLLTAQAPAMANELLLKSDLPARSTIPAEYYWNQFGCSGENLAPTLEWENVPEGTKSFAVTFYDLDAPTGSGFWHRVVYNLPADTNSLPGGKDGGVLPKGAIESNTDLGAPGFFGPCPPEGRQHRYQWTVHALSVDKLPVEEGATPALVGFFIWQHELAKSSLTLLAGPR